MYKPPAFLRCFWARGGYSLAQPWGPPHFLAKGKETQVLRLGMSLGTKNPTCPQQRVDLCPLWMVHRGAGLDKCFFLHSGNNGQWAPVVCQACS